MHYIGIDLHRRSVMIAVQDEKGVTLQIRNLDCSTPATIRRFASQYQPFEAVIEASSSYRWLYDLLVPLGDVLLAHPLRLRAIVSGRAKTDKLDAQLLASLLRADLIPKAYVPPRSYMELPRISHIGSLFSSRRGRQRDVPALEDRSRSLCIILCPSRGCQSPSETVSRQ